MIDDPVLINDWHPVASVRQLSNMPVMSNRLLGEDIVIWRSADGYHVWQDLCLHRGAKLSLGKVHNGEQIACAYHGWRFGKDGACVHIPAHPDQIPPSKARAKTYHAVERYGLIWACLGEPSNDVPIMPEFEDARFGAAVCGPFTHIRAHGPRLIENYLDAAHFPFVHEGMLGDPARAAMPEFEVRRTATGIESDPIFVYQPDPYGSASGMVSYTYHVYRPLTAHFTKHSPTTTNGMSLVITPHDELDSSGWFLVATTAQRDSERLRIDYEPRIRQIFEEDRAVVETQRPELLPLDLQEELHLRSDRVAIAYRAWLRELGLKFGAQ